MRGFRASEGQIRWRIQDSCKGGDAGPVMLKPTSYRGWGLNPENCKCQMENSEAYLNYELGSKVCFHATIAMSVCSVDTRTYQRI